MILVLFSVLGLLLLLTTAERKNSTADVQGCSLCEYLENTKESHYRVSLTIILYIDACFDLKLNTKGNPEYVKTLNYLFLKVCHGISLKLCT